MTKKTLFLWFIILLPFPTSIYQESNFLSFKTFLQAGSSHQFSSSSSHLQPKSFCLVIPLTFTNRLKRFAKIFFSFSILWFRVIDNNNNLITLLSNISQIGGISFFDQVCFVKYTWWLLNRMIFPHFLCFP